MSQADIQPHIQSSTQLSEALKQTLNKYFANLDGAEARNIYDLVLAQIEKPLLEIVMRQTQYNQSKASEWLGISRNTLRKLLEKYDLLN